MWQTKSGPSSVLRPTLTSRMRCYYDALAEENSRDESVTLGHPSSAEISILAISFLRLVNQARSLLEPHHQRALIGIVLSRDGAVAARERAIHEVRDCLLVNWIARGV